MIEFVAANLAPIMFVGLVAFILSGFPVAFSLAANGLLFFVIGVYLAPYASDQIRLDWMLLQAAPSRVFSTMKNEVLLAIPFFTFMGLVLERSGMAEDLLDTIGQLFSRVRGGLSYAVIFVGTLLAATTGVLSASVIAMGLISLPIMMRYGYDRRASAGVIAASGTLALIMPPSVVLIVLADQLSTPVGDMYEGAFLPALLLTGLYCVWMFILSIINKDALPVLPASAVAYREDDGSRRAWLILPMLLYSVLVGRYVIQQSGFTKGSDVVILILCCTSVVMFLSAVFNRFVVTRSLPAGVVGATGLVAMVWLLPGQGALGHAFLALTSAAAIYALIAATIERTFNVRIITRLVERVTFVMMPPLLLVFAVLGTIFVGVATPTEAGAMGAVGAVAIAVVMRHVSGEKRRFGFGVIRDATYATAKLSAFVITLLIGAGLFSLTFYGINGHIWVEHLFSVLPGGQLSFLIVISIMIFFLAFFLDFFELAFIVIPLLVPVAQALGIDMVWLGIVLAVNLQTAFMHPPFGFALLYLRSVAPKTAYVDRVTGERIQPVTTGQIYRGAIPFVIIQCITTGLIIAFPALVMHYKAPTSLAPKVDLQQQLKDLNSAPPENDMMKNIMKKMQREQNPQPSQ